MHYPYCLFIGFGKRIEVGMGISIIESSCFLDGSDYVSDRIEVQFDEFRGFNIVQGNDIITLTEDQAKQIIDKIGSKL